MNDTQTISVLAFALHYALTCGWRVFPLHSIENGHCSCGNTKCGSPGKHPLTKSGVLDATTDEARIRAWFGFEYPNANIGIATGKESGLVVVDVDEAKGANVDNLFIDYNVNVPDTPMVRTGGGFHFYFAYPNDVEIKNSASKLAQFIDVRGDGGYVVAPPSNHISGNTYEFTLETENLSEFPSEWIEKLKQPAQNRRVNSNGNSNGNHADNSNPFFVPPPYEAQKIPDEILYGTRHDELFRIACSLRAKGLPFEAVDAALQQINLKIVKPPGPEANVRKIALSAMKYDEDRELQSISDDTVQNWDDVTIARLFVDEYQSTVRFNVDARKWLVWTGTHWKTDHKGLVKLRAQKFSQDLYAKVPSLLTSSSDMTQAQRQIRRSNTNAGLNAFLDLAQTHLTITSGELDANNYLLNCQNCTVDLRSGAVSKHDPADLITKIVPYDYDPKAISPAFDDFLETIQPDAEIRKFLQQSIGYSLLGIVRERAFWIMYGAGNNGKSVFINLFSKILADYASSTTSSSVMNKKNESVPNDIARLQGKRFIVIPETEENERLNAALIKQLSGGDKITARFLFAEYFDFYFSGKLWIATNHKPTITDHSKGFWDRLKIIPFTVDIPKAKIIKQDTLLEKLLAEAPGILNWALAGVREYFAADSLNVPAKIQTEIDVYKYEQDSIVQFIEESCVVGSHFTVDNARIYKQYVEFCKDNGEFQRTQRRFTQNLKERGFSQHRGTTRYWEGLTLK